jgi:MFS family permease
MGMGAAFSAPLNAIFARRIDPAYRGRAMGVAVSGLLAAQGLGFVLAGALVDAGLSPAVATGLCGAAGTVVVAAAGLSWRRTVRTGSRRAGAPPRRARARPPLVR